MTKIGITIIVPVGPQQAYKEYLPECMDSVESQMEENDQLLIIDDMAYLSEQPGFIDQMWNREEDLYLKSLYCNDWLLGCAASWNVGVAFAQNEWCILMGSDDKLLPGCLDTCRKIIEDPKHDKKGFYNIIIETSEGEQSNLPNNAAMVSKSLWNLTGGFPLSAGVGAPDALLVSIMMVHHSQHLHRIGAKPLYWVRVHDQQDTGRQAGLFHSEVVSIRDKETARWEEPKWTK